MSISRDNHFVPQMYLKKWAKDNMLYQYRLLVSNENVPMWEKKNIKGIGYRNDLYTQVIGVEEVDDIERMFLQEYENPAKEPINKLVNDKRLSSEEWAKVSAFVAAQYMRTPAFYLKMRKILPYIFENETDNVIKKINETPELVNCKRRTNVNALPIKVENTNIKVDDKTIFNVEMIVGKTAWYNAMKDILNDKTTHKTMRTFKEMKWSVFNCPNNMCMPTTDNPVVVCKKEASGYGITDGLLGENIIIFPLSPNKILAGKCKNRLPYVLDLTENEFIDIKNVIIDNAFMFVYSAYEDNYVIDRRKRVVDEAAYKRIENEFNNMHNEYVTKEVPWLK